MRGLDILGLGKDPSILQRCARGLIVVGVVADGADGHGRDELAADGGVEGVPRVGRRPGGITGEDTAGVVGALGKDTGGGEGRGSEGRGDDGGLHLGRAGGGAESLEERVFKGMTRLLQGRLLTAR